MTGKKKYLLLVVSGLFCLEIIQAQWITEKSPSINNLNSIHLISDHSGWIVGDKGTMLYKVSSNWINYQRITNENLYSVFMLDKNDGWAVGSKGTILHFDGKNWQDFESPTRENLFSVSFNDPENGIAVGAHGTVVIYDNGTWELAKKSTRGNLYTVSVKNDVSMVGGGLECVNIPIMRVADDAEKTLTNSFDPLIEIKSIAQAGQRNMWAVGSRGKIFHFNGSEWERLESDNKLPSLNCVFFSDENNGITVGYYGTILIYSEKTWTKQNPPVTVKLNGSAISGKNYYAVGNNGTIVSLKQVSENDPAYASNQGRSAIKIETYPNPSAGILNIIIPDKDGFVPDQISISNVYGQVVLNKRIDPDTGNQVYQINTSELNNGLYLVNITSSGRTEASGKFMVRH